MDDASRRHLSRRRRRSAPPRGLDALSRPASRDEIEELVTASGGRLLATCRPGGSGTPPSEADRVELLALAARAGAAAVDAELGSAAVAMPLPEGCERIASHHEAEDAAAQRPEDARRLVAALRETGASSLKLAAPAGDAARALAWMKAVLAGRGLSSLLYCAEGEPAAAGQPGLDDLLDVHAAERCDAATPVFAIVGWPLRRTWSPLVHGTLLRRAGREGIFVPLCVREASAVLPLLDELGVHAAAVTMPHKRAFSEASVARSERVGRSGSLNSLRRGSEGWEAESFDGPAAFAAIGGTAALADAHVAVLGAGGAAAALLDALVQSGVRSTVLARRWEAAQELAGSFGVRAVPLDDLGGLQADVVVNATPGEPCSPLARRLAFDMRTTPADTDWLRRAAAAGLELVDGLSMFARQAAAQQRWWGLEVEDDEAEACLRELVASRGGEAA
jgi:shikimate 5-dehydrogenase/3-dehydroquinate dehydratase